MRNQVAVALVGLAALVPALGRADNVPEASKAVPPVIRISVERVQLDAVVTDKKGRHVTDLGPEEIEVFQDGTRQAVSDLVYVRSAAPAAPSGPGLASTSATAPSVSGAAAASVPARTVLIVLDDLSFGAHSFDRTIRAVRQVIETLDPRDRVDVVTTSKGARRLVLTTDRKANQAALGDVRRTAWTRAELSNVWASPEAAAYGMRALRYDGSVFDTVDDWMVLRSIAVVKESVTALRAIPGRKALLLVSEGLSRLDGYTLPQVREIYWPLDRLYGDANDLYGALRRLAELAARSGVVIDAVDPRGLVTGGVGVEDSVADVHDVKAYARMVSGGHLAVYGSQSSLQYLSDETGGLALVDRNDLSRSIASIMDDLSGYYLVGYTPAAGTFDRSRFLRVDLKVKRPGLKVRTRQGFYPVTDDELAAVLP